MKPALLLIDLQHDFLRSAGLEPAAAQVVDRAAALLRGYRTMSLPVIHIWTTVRPQDDRRMPHWKRDGQWICIEGSEGHATPEPLRPAPGEPVFHKTFFSAFSNDRLGDALVSLGVSDLVLAGVHLHGCIRVSALDGYQRGFRVIVGDDAVASDDPVHAAVTRRYLGTRAASFLTVESILTLSAPAGRMQPPSSFVAQRSPHYAHNVSWRIPASDRQHVTTTAGTAKRAWLEWRKSDRAQRVGVLHSLSRMLQTEADSLARQTAVEIGKPIAQARAEIVRAVALVDAAIRHCEDAGETRCGPHSSSRSMPVGVVAAITPFNNPVAIPVGKIAPALLYGNVVVWKPAPAASGVARSIMRLIEATSCPSGVVSMLAGDRCTAAALMEDDKVDAVTLTGCVAAGYAAAEVCARRHVPLQGELGGNNAAIIWSDCDVAVAARAVAEAAFSFAGQRCTANRRVIVERRSYDEFLEALRYAAAAIAWGDPLDEATQCGPLVSDAARERIAALVSRTVATSTAVLVPHEQQRCRELARAGAYYPPTIVCCDEPAQEIVQEESFGPVLVVQGADDWDHALQLCNGVRQGLAAALFSASGERQSAFLHEARAGILKINEATADADAEAPFGGWKASGIGPPEHGASDRGFYTRAQAIYQNISRQPEVAR